jgi:hypothetical protein
LVVAMYVAVGFVGVLVAPPPGAAKANAGSRHSNFSHFIR